MKKVLSVVMAITILLCLMLSASGFSLNDDQKLNKNELSIIKWTGKICNKTDKEIAIDILKKADMPQDKIDMMPENKLMEISDVIEIAKVSEYFKIEKDCSANKISKVDYNKLSKKIEQDKLKRAGAPEQYYSEESDSVFEKALWVVRTKNAPKGTYGVIGAFDWKNFGFTFRGKDIVALSGEGLSFIASSLSATVKFTKTTAINGKSHPNQEETYNYDYNNSRKNIKQEANGIAFCYDLKWDVNSSNYSLTYTDVSVMLFCSSILNNPDSSHNFNVFSNYMHQWLKFMIGFSFDFGKHFKFNGVSISITPTLNYKKYQIATSSPIKYNP